MTLNCEKELLLLAEEGNSDAQFNLGWCYKNGKGMIRNRQEAEKWWRRAATNGQAKAQFSLGIHFTKELGADESLGWIQKAAEGGNANAQSYVCMLHFWGVLMPKDMTIALKWGMIANEISPSLPRRLFLMVIKVCARRGQIDQAAKLVAEWHAARHKNAVLGVSISDS